LRSVIVFASLNIFSSLVMLLILPKNKFDE